MLAIQRITCVVLLMMIIIPVSSGCISTVQPTATPTPQPTPDPRLAPEEVVTAFWSDIDSGRYADAYQLAYHEQNVSYEGWIRDHETTYGVNGSYLEIYKFSVAESFPISPGTFEGNFSAVQVVVADTKMSFQSKNRTGTVQFPVVRAAGGWRIYGDY